MASAPARFVSGGELSSGLRKREAKALVRCGDEMRAGLEPTINRFGDLYLKVPVNASLKTPSVRRGIDTSWLLCGDPKRIWGYFNGGSEQGRLLEIAGDFEHKIKTLLAGVLDFDFRSGPIKERRKIIDEINWRWPQLSGEDEGEVDENDQRICLIRDIIRGRIEALTLADVEIIFQHLLRKETRLQVVACFNTYQNLFPSRRDYDLPRPYLACNFTFAAGDHMPYELQVMTRQAALVGKLTHPGFLLQETMSEKLQEDAETLAWASHIMDYEDYLGSQTA